MASCGFDAEVAYQVHRKRHEAFGGHLARWSYVKPILDTVRSYQYPEIRADRDCAKGVPGEGEIRVAECPLGRLPPTFPPYCWGMQLPPWADGTDGAIDLCAFEGGSLWNGLRYAAAAQFGWLGRLSDCRVARATRLRLSSDRPVRYQLDGDPGGWLPLEIEALPGRVTLVAPATR